MKNKTETLTREDYVHPGLVAFGVRPPIDCMVRYEVDRKTHRTFQEELYSGKGFVRRFVTLAVCAATAVLPIAAPFIQEAERSDLTEIPEVVDGNSVEGSVLGEKEDMFYITNNRPQSIRYDFITNK